GKLEGSLAGGKREFPMALSEVAGGFGDEDAGQFVDHVASGERCLGLVQVGMRVGPVTVENIEPAEDPFALGDIILPTLRFADFPISLSDLARTFLGANADEVLGPSNATPAVEVSSFWMDSILDCIRFREVSIGAIYVAAEGSGVAYE